MSDEPELEFDIDYQTAIKLLTENADLSLNGKLIHVIGGENYRKLLAQATEIVRGEQPTTQFSDILEWCEMHEDMFMDSGTDSNHGEHTSWERFDPRHAAWLIRHVITKGLIPYTGEDYARDREGWDK